MQNFKPVELEDVYRLFNLGATSLVSAADGDDVDVMPATWVCPLNTTPALSTAVIDSVHYTRKLIDKTGYFMLSLPSLAIARETLYLGSVSKFDEADKIEKSGAKLFKFEGCDIPTVEGVLCAVLFKVISNEYNEKKHDLFIGEAVAAWADSRVFSEGHWHFPDPRDTGTSRKVTTAAGRFTTSPAVISLRSATPTTSHSDRFVLTHKKRAQALKFVRVFYVRVS